MTTDWRALCAELVKELDDLRESSEGVAGFHRNGDLAPWSELGESGEFPWLSSFDRARALLAEPEQDSVISVKQHIFPTPSQAAECGGPCYEGNYCPEACDCGLYQPPALAEPEAAWEPMPLPGDAEGLAEVFWAKPEAVGPTADELIGLALGREPWATWLRSGGCLESAHCELADLMLAAIARWGRPAAAPVPVSERLPGPEDCDAEGRCWLGGRQMSSGTPTWLFGYPGWAERFPDVHHFWLPANALPLPEVSK